MKKEMDVEKSPALELYVEQEIAKTSTAIAKLEAAKGKPLELDEEMMLMEQCWPVEGVGKNSQTATAGNRTLPARGFLTG